MSPRHNRRAPPPAARGRPANVEVSFARQQAQREQCQRKQWFATESEARAFALMQRTQYGEDRVPYDCEYCDGWHLASRER